MGVSLNTDEFDARFDEAIARAEHGEEVIVCRNGKQVARIVPEHAGGARIRTAIVFGSGLGEIELAEGWDAPLTPEELTDWLGGPLFPTDSLA